MNKRGISKERALGLLQELFNKSGEPDSVNSDIKELQDLTPGIIVSGNIQYGIGGIQAAIAINFDDPIISDKVNNFDINKVPNNVTLNSNTLDINRDYGAANETVKRVKDFVEQLAKE